MKLISPRALLASSLLACSAAQALPWTVQLNSAAGKPVAGAAVAVELLGRASKAASSVKAEMAQRERQFQPALLIVQTGTAVNFPNFDVVRHHVYSFSPIKVIDVKLYSGTPSEPIVFDKPGVATLGCNIHDRMSAHIVVVDSPLFGITDANGSVKFELPAGEHRLKVWHAGMKTQTLQSQTLVVPANAPAGDAQTSLTLSE
ncbi:methylamine utilization protein [Roseateles oligotrophus]|uniref:Methylamine utilization protein n=1 Tax=Roseateles oligotrophus TaxID=1769250 RepID=A0ABT2YD28_9BURK|nr:methylamine utilization protein [Roseateles oligotrophus]MCV2367921.1 methylamine utilization protein [Roseateles oligotrophus]